ncbi:protein LURP-one-related 15-like [Curcuma longa]|uniref:protein LURP-one-related 15-like n=1 Tax=Curcuma longa TaxID=136217 RepID=UPI003D9F94C1
MADGQKARNVAPAELVAARQFTVPYAVNLTLTGTRGLFSPNDLYKVKDTNGDLVFKVKGVSFGSRRLLLDAAGTPLLTMKPKVFSWHQTWRVFRGESTSPNDLLFSMRRPKIFQWKDNFDVVLAVEQLQVHR